MRNIEEAAEAVTERLTPAPESLEDNVRSARRTVTQVRDGAKDFVTERSLEIRRHPLTSVILAGAVGAAVGCALGFALGWQARAGCAKENRRDFTQE